MYVRISPISLNYYLGSRTTAPCSSLQLKPLKRDSLREQWACVSSLIFSARTVKAHTLRSNSSDLGINHTGFEDDPLIASMGPFLLWRRRVWCFLSPSTSSVQWVPRQSAATSRPGPRNVVSGSDEKERMLASDWSGSGQSSPLIGRRSAAGAARPPFTHPPISQNDEYHEIEVTMCHFSVLVQLL